MPRLLAVHAHPDDETLATGALLATWAAAGQPVTVVTCTRGERGEVIPPALAALEGDGPALGSHRRRELAAATAALGVTRSVLLDELPDAEGHPAQRQWQDSGMTWLDGATAGAAGDAPDGSLCAAPLPATVERLALVLTTERPDVVVTYEPQGGYGHPDHVRAHEITMAAVAAASTPQWAPEVWWAAIPADELSLATDELITLLSSPDGAGAPDGTRLPEVDAPVPSAVSASIDVLVDVEPVRDRLLAAMRSHRTQITAVTSIDGEHLRGCSALSHGVLAPLLRVEGYRVAAVGRRPDRLALDLPEGVRRHPSMAG